MAGIYIHIPFCKKACHYCNFHFSVSLKNKNDFIAALLKEIMLQKNYLGQQEIETVYFGGGTPSILEKEDIGRILQQLQSCFSLAADAELTLESNPDDISAERLNDWKERGINRLSIGVQSFFDEDLRWMNRAHDANQARSAIALARQAGFHNLSVDLIYGTPGLTDQRWAENVSIALAMGIPHLSCYALTVEPGTALQKMIARHKKQDTDPEKQARHFLLLADWLQEAGYEHYEISNFALPGHRSRHNSSYWGGKKYLGLGPAAHSFNGSVRQWNIANNARYIASLNLHTLIFEEERLSPVQRLNEYIMTSLRVSEGLDLARVAAGFGENARQRLLTNSLRYIKEGKLLLNDTLLRLTREGKLFADGIAADLFFTPEDVLLVAPAVNGSYDEAGILQTVPMPEQASLQ
ncbi:MAG: radical SAM family heme chaperone HemW [Bacteroidota bacterium]